MFLVLRLTYSYKLTFAPIPTSDCHSSACRNSRFWVRYNPPRPSVATSRNACTAFSISMRLISSQYTGRFFSSPSFFSMGLGEVILFSLASCGFAHTASPTAMLVLLCTPPLFDHACSTAFFRPVECMSGAANESATIASRAGCFWSVITFSASNQGSIEPMGE